MTDGWPVAGDAAETYERELVQPLFAEWPVRALEAADVSPGQRVLDIACGTGVVARAALDLGCKVAGVDPDAGMLEVARSLAPQAEFFEGSAESLPFPDDSFDAAIMQFGLMFVPDPREPWPRCVVSWLTMARWWCSSGPRSRRTPATASWPR